ncbi:MAG: hypothetical protein M1324_04615 [Patescibacteria group bacterium]|nr:hypothetical protein [Patescibacteria group bacterium]
MKNKISCIEISELIKEITFLNNKFVKTIEGQEIDTALNFQGELRAKLDEAWEKIGFLSLEKAKEIMGEDMIDPKEMESVLKYEIKNIPRIPFSREILERSKDYGMRLILRVPVDFDMEMMSVYSMFSKYLPDHETDLNDPTLMRKEVSYDRVKSEWVLVSKDIITDTTFKTFDPPQATGTDYKNDTNQISRLINDFYFVDGYHGIYLPREIIETLREWNGNEKDLLDNIPPKEQGQKLVNQKINKVFRHSPAEIVYDWLVISKLRDGKWLEGKNIWTNKTYPDNENKIVVVSPVCDAEGNLRPVLRRHAHNFMAGSSMMQSLFVLRDEEMASRILEEK